MSVEMKMPNQIVSLEDIHLAEDGRMKYFEKNCELFPKGDQRTQVIKVCYKSNEMSTAYVCTETGCGAEYMSMGNLIHHVVTAHDDRNKKITLPGNRNVSRKSVVLSVDGSGNETQPGIIPKPKLLSKNSLVASRHKKSHTCKECVRLLSEHHASEVDFNKNHCNFTSTHASSLLDLARHVHGKENTTESNSSNRILEFIDAVSADLVKVQNPIFQLPTLTADEVAKNSEDDEVKTEPSTFLPCESLPVGDVDYARLVSLTQKRIKSSNKKFRNIECHEEQVGVPKLFKCKVYGCKAAYKHSGSLWNHTVRVHKGISRKPNCNSPTDDKRDQDSCKRSNGDAVLQLSKKQKFKSKSVSRMPTVCKDDRLPQSAEPSTQQEQSFKLTDGDAVLLASKKLNLDSYLLMNSICQEPHLCDDTGTLKSEEPSTEQKPCSVQPSISIVGGDKNLIQTETLAENISSDIHSEDHHPESHMKQFVKQLINHSNVSKPFKCKIRGCEAVYKHSGSLWNHTAVVHKGKPIFKRKSASKAKHSLLRNTNTGKDWYKCDKCDAVRSTAEKMKSHSYLHTKPYKCNEEHCNAAYSHSKTLLVHKKLVHVSKVNRKAGLCKTGSTNNASKLQHDELVVNGFDEECVSNVSPSTLRTKLNKSVSAILRKNGEVPVSESECSIPLYDYAPDIGGKNLPHGEALDGKPDTAKCKNVVRCRNRFVSAKANLEKSQFNSNNGLKLFKCKVHGCKAAYKHPGSLWNHTQSAHYGRKLYKRKVSTKNRSALLEDSSKLYKCGECSAELSSALNLKLHSYLHRDSRPHNHNELYNIHPTLHNVNKLCNAEPSARLIQQIDENVCQHTNSGAQLDDCSSSELNYDSSKQLKGDLQKQIHHHHDEEAFSNYCELCSSEFIQSIKDYTEYITSLGKSCSLTM